MDYKKLAKLYNTFQIYPLLIRMEHFSIPDMITTLSTLKKGKWCKYWKDG